MGFESLFALCYFEFTPMPNRAKSKYVGSVGRIVRRASVISSVVRLSLALRWVRFKALEVLPTCTSKGIYKSAGESEVHTPISTIPSLRTNQRKAMFNRFNAVFCKFSGKHRESVTPALASAKRLFNAAARSQGAHFSPFRCSEALKASRQLNSA